MNSNELKDLIENARIEKDISQRELAKRTGISRSTLNDLINGKIKKVDIDDLRKIADTLDMSLQQMLKVAGYDEFLLYFAKDKYAGQSNKDLKELIEKYKESEYDLLDFDAKKRDEARRAGLIVHNVMEHLELVRDGKSKYTMDQAVKDLSRALEALEPIYEKYDYSKLPKKFY